MPRRPAVYGKRSAPNYLSSSFSSFSPAASHKQPTHIRFDRTPSPPPQQQEIAVTSLETALEQLNVAVDDEDAADDGFLDSRGKVETSIETAIEQLDGAQDEKQSGCFTPPNGVLQPRSVNMVQNVRESSAPEKTLDKMTVVTTLQDKKASSPAPRPIQIRGKTSSAKVQPSQPIIASEALITHAQPILDVCATASDTTATIINFHTWANKASKRFSVTKIAEASYGEVYRLSSKSSKTKSSESVFKIIPLQPPPLLPGQRSRGKKRNLSYMSTISSVTSEISLLRRMSPIPGFTSFRGASVMRGPLPPPFTSAWKAYKQLQKEGLKKIVDGGSMFPDPTRKGAYSPDQLWAVIEMQDAGTDLETKVLEGAGEVWDAFWGVACALAKGEEGVRFEHRDLHLGNICVRTKNESRGDSVKCRTESAKGWKLGTSGLETTIIDYTLSRADMKDPTSRSNNARSTNDVAFYDLEEDPGLFEGDADVDYQYEIYRLMRTEIFSFSTTPAVETHNDNGIHVVANNAGWHAYSPRTNVLWLHYILSTLLNRTFPYLATPASYSSSSMSVERELKKRLETLVGLMDPRTGWFDLKKGRMEFRSVSAVVAYAVEEGWLKAEDVVG